MSVFFYNPKKIKSLDQVWIRKGSKKLSSLFRIGNPDPDQNILVSEYDTRIDYRLRKLCLFLRVRWGWLILSKESKIGYRMIIYRKKFNENPCLIFAIGRAVPYRTQRIGRKIPKNLVFTQVLGALIIVIRNCMLPGAGYLIFKFILFSGFAEAVSFRLWWKCNSGTEAGLFCPVPPDSDCIWEKTEHFVPAIPTAFEQVSRQ